MKVQNPIIGRARGSAGGMTFCKNYDKNVARAKAFEVSNPKTQAQQTQRAFFADLTALCADFSEEQLRFLFPSKPKTMSRRNAISKQIAQSYSVDGTVKSINFSIINTLGNAPVMDLGKWTLEINQNYLNIDWSNEVPAGTPLANNIVVIVAINSDKKSVQIIPTESSFDDGVAGMPVPSGWDAGDEMYGFVIISNTLISDGAFPGFDKAKAIRRPKDLTD